MRTVIAGWIIIEDNGRKAYPRDPEIAQEVFRVLDSIKHRQQSALADVPRAIEARERGKE